MFESNKSFWGEVWKILQEECGALADDQGFVSRAGDFYREWRFVGALGFGGKVWNNDGRVYVSCYREDETTKRRAMIKKANNRLAKLVKKYTEAPQEAP